MRVRIIVRSLRVALLPLLVGSVSVAHAAGQVSLSWDDCSPIVSAKSSDGAHAYSAYVSVIGQTEGHQGYQVFAHFSIPPPGGSIRDAWRFDATGCQGSSLLRLDHLPPAAVEKTCPAFVGSGQVLTIKDFSYDPITGRARAVIAVAYPAGVASPDPNVRYFLGRMEFDHTYSVVGEGAPGLTCGGFEHDVRISLIQECLGDPRFCTPSRASWLDLNGVEHDFAIADPTLTFCGSCGSTPATQSTWGAIKGHYRR